MPILFYNQMTIIKHSIKAIFEETRQAKEVNVENKKILIIDDDQVIVKYLQKLFKNNGYDTILAYDGLEADDIIKEHTPALITLDLDMPN